MKSKKFILACLLACTFLFAACGAEERYDTETDAPENLLPKEKFVSMLTDILLIDVYVSTNQVRSEQPFKVYRTYEKALLDKHGVDTAQYFASFDYYYGNSKIAEYINIMLMDSLQSRRNAYFGTSQDSTSKKDERNYR